MRHLNHVLDLQIGSPRKGSGYHLLPSCKLSRSANERLPRTDESHLSPHGPSKRAAHFFGILQSFQPTAPQALHMVSQIRHRITRGPGDSGNAGPHPKYQSLQQWIAGQSVGAVHTAAGHLARSKKTRQCRGSVDVGRHPTHHVMGAWRDRDPLFRDIDIMA